MMNKDILIYFTGKTIPAAVTLIIIVLAVRILGDAEYGKYSLILYATLLLGTFTFGWIQQSILRFLTAYPDETRSVTSRFFTLTLFSSSMALITSLFISKIYFQTTWTDAVIIGFYIFFYNVFLFYLTIYQAKRESAKYAILEGIYHIGYLAVFLLLAGMVERPGFNLIFIAMVSGLILSGLIRTFILNRAAAETMLTGVEYQAAFTEKVFKFGFPVTLWLFISYLVNISDRFILKEFASYAEVGTYSAVKDLIIKIATFTTIPVLLSYHPAIVEKWNQGARDKAMVLVRQGLMYCLIIMIVTSTVVLAGREMLYKEVLHLRVTDSLLVTLSLLSAAFAWQAAMLVHKPLELLLKPGLMLAAVVSAFCINALLNFLLIPVYGYKAAAVTSLVSVLSYILFILAFLYNYRKNGLLK